MVISNQAPRIFAAVFSQEEAKQPETCVRFLRVIGCINLFAYQSDYSINALKALMVRGCGSTSGYVPLWWERTKAFRTDVHPLIQLTSASPDELIKLGFDMTPEVSLDVVVRIWNETLKVLRKEP